MSRESTRRLEGYEVGEIITTSRDPALIGLDRP